ncbi:MAG: hypothetical protein IH940_10220 [Acidobacteria bacterium]|nr:hypothetical protein [Acidobacteriota bacterium]
MRRTAMVVTLAMLTTVALVACSDDDAGEPESEQTSTTAADQTDDFPVPSPEGFINIVDFGGMARQYDYVDGEFENIVEFYDDWTAEQDESYEVVHNAEDALWTSKTLTPSIRISAAGGDEFVDHDDEQIDVVSIIIVE